MRRIRAFSLGACIVVTPVLTGCNALVLDNTVTGLREGTIATVTGVINGFFDQHFSIRGSDGESVAGKGGGDDLFVRS